MILDLMRSTTWISYADAFGTEPTRVEGVGVAVMTDRVDIANVRLEPRRRRACGLTASRVSREPVRKLRIFQEDAYFSVDFSTQGGRGGLARAGPGTLGLARPAPGSGGTTTRSSPSWRRSAPRSEASPPVS